MSVNSTPWGCPLVAHPHVVEFTDATGPAT